MISKKKKTFEPKLSAIPNEKIESASNANLDPRDLRQPKPRFLAQLESFIEREMAILGCHTSDEPSAARLQIYREAFQVYSLS